MIHLVYCDDKEKELEKILQGEKTMVIRGAAGRKTPHSRVFEGEMLYFMEKGTAKITASATVTSVQNYIKLTDEEISEIILKNQDKLKLSEKQKERWRKKCLILVEFKDVKEINPMEYERQNNMDDWLILDKIEDVIAGSSIQFKYKTL